MDLHEIKKPKIYNMHETAEFMGVSYITLYRMVKSGTIKALNVARSGKKPIYGFTAEMIQEYYDRIGTRHSEENPDDAK